MKLNKRFLALLLAVTMMLGMLPTVFAAELSLNHDVATYTIDNALAGKIDPNAPDNTIENGETFNLQLDLTVPQDGTLGDVYSYTLPAGFVIYDDAYMVMDYAGDVSQGSVPTGKFNVSYNSGTSTSTVTIEMNQAFYENDFNREVMLNLKGKFHLPAADPDGDGDIEIPGIGEKPTYIPVDTPNYSVNVNKKGTSRRDSTGHYVDYTITVHAGEGGLTNVIVTDTPDDDVTFVDNSACLDSNPSLETVKNGNLLVWTIPSIVENDSCEITYTVKLNDSFDYQNKHYVVNGVEARSDEYAYDSDTCTVYLNTPTVTKSGTANGSVVTWTIKVNFNDWDYVVVDEHYSNNGHPTFTEMANQGAAPVTIKYEDGTSPAGSYTWNDLISGGIRLDKTNSNTYVTLTYQTTVSSNFVDKNTSISNKVWAVAGGHAGEGSYSVPLQKADRIISKTGVDQAIYMNNDGGGQTRISWVVELQFEGKPSDLYNNPTFTDVLVNQSGDAVGGAVDHKYDSGTFRLIYLGDEAFNPDKNYSNYTSYSSSDNYNNYLTKWETGEFQYDYSGGLHYFIGGQALQHETGSPMFELTFSDSAPAGKYVLLYETTYDPKGLEREDYYGPTFKYGESDDTPLSLSVKNYIFATNKEYEDADTSIVSSYIRKKHNTVKSSGDTVVWNIEILDSYSSLQGVFYENGGAVFTDTLPDGFTVEKVSITNSNGSQEIELGNVPDEWDWYDPNAEKQAYYYLTNDNQLVIGFNPNGYLLGFSGKFIAGTVIEVTTKDTNFKDMTPGTQKNAVNKVQLKINGIDYPTVQATAIIKCPPLIEKSVSYTAAIAPRPMWTIKVNPNAEDMKPDDDSLTIVDTIEGKHTIVPGTLTVNGESYTNYTLNEDKTQISINGLRDDTTYTITYRTYVNVPYDSNERLTLKNTAVLSGVLRGGKEVSDTATYSGRVIYPSGTSMGSKTDRIVTVTKTDSVTGKTVSGAVFTIYKNAVAETNIAGTITTGANGVSDDFYVTDRNTIYIMKETQAPDGYVLDDTTEYKFGIYPNDNAPEGVYNLYSVLGKNYEIQNTPAISTTSLTIKKSGGESDESFLMTVEGEGCDLQIVVPANGSVTIDGLQIGETYTVTEDATWAKRYTSSGPARITLDADVTKNTVTITNTKSIFKWLYGDSICENRWNANGIERIK